MKNNKMNWGAFFICALIWLLAVSAVLLTACKKQGSYIDLIGQWEHVKTQLDYYNNYKFNRSITFEKPNHQEKVFIYKNYDYQVIEYHKNSLNFIDTIITNYTWAADDTTIQIFNDYYFFDILYRIKKDTLIYNWQINKIEGMKFADGSWIDLEAKYYRIE